MTNGHELATLERPLPTGVPAVLETMDGLKSIRTFLANELKNGVDYGKIPGAGDKNVLYLPGAQKVGMFLNVYPTYPEIRATELGHGHVEYLVRTEMVSRSTGQVVGSGIGSCSTMEGKYRWRDAKRACPSCGQATIIKGKEQYGGGWVCHKKQGGCGTNFRDDDPQITGQRVGKAENDNIHDLRNTVLKMAKKRSLVDASIGLACLADQFTQDLDDVYDLGAAADLEDEVPPPKKAGRREPETRPEPDRDRRPADDRDTDPAHYGGPTSRKVQRPSWDDFLREVMDSWSAFDRIAPGGREGRIARLINALATRAIADGRIDEEKVTRPADDGKGRVRIPPRVRDAVKWLYRHDRKWVRATTKAYLDEKRAEAEGPAKADPEPAPAEAPAPTQPPGQAPRNGKALFFWVKDQEQKHEVGLLKYLNGWAKLQEFPGRMIDWDAEQVAMAYREAVRKVEAIQPSRNEPHPDAVSNEPAPAGEPWRVPAPPGAGESWEPTGADLARHLEALANRHGADPYPLVVEWAANAGRPARFKDWSTQDIDDCETEILRGWYLGLTESG